MEMTFYNPSGDLTFSDSGFIYSYIGLATATGIVQAGTDPIENYTGYSTYTITWAGDIVVVLPVKTNGATTIVDVSQSGTTWTITVMKSDGTTDSLGFSVQEYTEVYVFGTPSSTATSQFMIYSNGVPSGDLSKQPFFCKGLLSLSNSTSDNTWTPPSTISSPGILGASACYRKSSAASGSRWINKEFGYAWLLNGDGSISRVQYLTSWNNDEATIGNTTVAFQDVAMITTVTNL